MMEKDRYNEPMGIPSHGKPFPMTILNAALPTTPTEVEMKEDMKGCHLHLVEVEHRIILEHEEGCGGARAV